MRLQAHEYVYMRSARVEVKRGMRNSVILLNLSYASDVEVECSTEITNTSSGNEVCFVLRWDAEGNEGIYKGLE